MESRTVFLGRRLPRDACARLAEKGYDPDFGARPLRRALSSYIEDPLAENLLSGEFLEGDSIKVTRKEEQDHLSFEAIRSEGDDDGGGDDDSPEPEQDSANAASA